jgi:hypothetical protein
VSSYKRRRIIGGGYASILQRPSVTPSTSPTEVAPSTSPTEVTPSTSPTEVTPTNDKNDPLNALTALIFKNLGNNNKISIESKQLFNYLPVIDYVIDLLRTNGIDAEKLDAIKQKINDGQVLTLVDLLDLIRFLYTNRVILKSRQSELKPLFESLLDLVIDKLPINIKIIAIPIKQVFMSL